MAWLDGWLLDYILRFVIFSISNAVLLSISPFVDVYIVTIKYWNP